MDHSEVTTIDRELTVIRTWRLPNLNAEPHTMQQHRVRHHNRYEATDKAGR